MSNPFTELEDRIQTRLSVILDEVQTIKAHLWASEPLNKDGKELITRKELKEKFQVSYPTLWRWEQQGKITAIGIGGKRYYNLEDVTKSLITLNK